MKTFMVKKVRGKEEWSICIQGYNNDMPWEVHTSIEDKGLANTLKDIYQRVSNRRFVVQTFTPYYPITISDRGSQCMFVVIDRKSFDREIQRFESYEVAKEIADAYESYYASKEQQ